MKKQRIFRVLIFTIIVIGVVLMLIRFDEKRKIQNEGRVLPAQVEDVVEKVKDFPEKEEVKSFQKKVLGSFQGFILKTPAEKVEQNVKEIIKQIQSLPQEQLEEVKKTVFCNEVCEKTCQDVCE